MEPRLCAESVGIIMILEVMSRVGSEILENCSGRIMSNNKVLD